MKLFSKSIILAAALILTLGLFNLLAGPAMDMFHSGDSEYTVLSDSMVKMNKTVKVLVEG